MKSTPARWGLAASWSIRSVRCGVHSGSPWGRKPAGKRRAARGGQPRLVEEIGRIGDAAGEADLEQLLGADAAREVRVEVRRELCLFRGVSAGRVRVAVVGQEARLEGGEPVGRLEEPRRL